MPMPQEQPDVDRLDAVVRRLQIEHRAKAADRLQRPHRRRFDRAARDGDDRLDLRALRERGELAAREVDREAPREVLPRRDRRRRRARCASRPSARASAPPADACPSTCDSCRAIRRRAAAAPRDSRTRRCCRRSRSARCSSTSWIAPLPQPRFRLDPDARPVVVEDAVVLVVLEVAVPLQQAEAARALVEIRADAQRGGLLSGRQIHSPLPVQIASPSESWISGRQSLAMRRSFSPH